MATNGTDIALETRHPLDHMPARKRTLDHRAPEAEYLTSAGASDPVEAAEDFALAPLVDKIAYGIARGLIVAVKELEHHIASETRKVGDSVGRGLDALQVGMQELSQFVGEQRSTNVAVQDQLRLLDLAGAELREADARQRGELEDVRTQAREFTASVSQKIDVSTASLQESDARQTTELAALREETRVSASSVSQRIDDTVASLTESDSRQAAGLLALQNEVKVLSQSIAERIDGLCKELGVHQEDIATTKATLSAFCTRVDALVDRLDRQADAVRSMCTAYSQRETELEQLVDGLARLRAYPTPLPANGL